MSGTHEKPLTPEIRATAPPPPPPPPKAWSELASSTGYAADPIPADVANKLAMKIAACIAHRVCGNEEQDLQNGKLAGYCIVCQLPWPCATAKQFLFVPNEKDQ